MSIGQDVATGLDAAGGLALSQSINMTVGDESTFGHETAFYRTSTVVNHPDTNDVMSGKSPWMVAVGAPGLLLVNTLGSHGNAQTMQTCLL